MREAKNYTTLDKSVIKTLLYYDIFNYPLKGNEVFHFLGVNSVTEKDVIASLNNLAREQHIFRFGEFYSVQPCEENVVRRTRGNKEAEKFTTVAHRKALLIAGFPFVRAVMASGSLSKNYMDEKSDLDFFIVTAPHRLWIARTLLVLYKRIVLKNSHKLFCVNYFVDSAHLEIEEKNLFTATELATVIPLYGAMYYQQLQEQNHHWLIKYFPNFRPRSLEGVPESKRSLLKVFCEKAIGLLMGNVIEKWLMYLTQRRWKKIYQKQYAMEDFRIAFKTKKHASKNHPRHFQKSVMQLYEQRLGEFSKKLEMDL